MQGLIDIERKGYESIGCVLYLLCGLQLWPWPWIFKVKFWKCCISGMGGHKKDVSREGVRITLGLQTLTSPMTLTLDLQGKILKLLYLRNGRVDSLGKRVVWVGYDVGCTTGLTLATVHVNLIGQVMGQCETLTVSHLLASEWAIRSLI